ncbi:hypothetical protein D6D01_05357 [Aureobasidium pullulans]|uniref:Uncharacterized protein n=1 Tax=Aureobasidium pullulans TaxID=5580 RepID=A0A4V4JVA5_AURPU|nr:hypothetical protein D6D01_05357 [Aureobasidium pullulans]
MVIYLQHIRISDQTTQLITPPPSDLRPQLFQHMTEHPTMRDTQAFKPSASLSGTLVREPSTPKRSKIKKQHPTRAIDSGREEFEQDPSPHAQPHAPTPSIKSEPDHESTCSTDDDDDFEQEMTGHASELLSISNDDGVHTTEIADVRSISSLSTHRITEADPLEDDYLSDDDLIEEDAKKAEGYLNMSASEKRAWEGKRAETFFRAGFAKHFECSIHLLEEEHCTTHQEYYPSRCAARPVISCFFGHNKNEWNQIVKSVRVMLCRRCYQRLDHKHKPHLASIQLPVCQELINRLERWRPACRFSIGLTKAMSAKVDRFNLELASCGLTRQEVAAAIDVNRPNRKGADIDRAENTPVLFAIELKNRFEGDNKTSGDVRALLDWLAVRLADGTIEDLPAFEALLKLRPQDKKKLLAQQRRRATLKRSRRSRASADKGEVHQSRKVLKAKPVSDSGHIAETADTPTPGPSRAAISAILPPARTFKAINVPIASSSRTSLLTASGSDSSGLDLLCTAGDFVRDGSSGTDPFVSSVPPARTQIMLKFGKGKMPIITNPVTEASQAQIPKKRKRITIVVREDSKVHKDAAPAAKKAKRAKAVPKEAAQEQLSVEKFFNAQTIDIGSNDQASSSKEMPKQKIEIKNGATHLASLTFSGMKVIVDFAPTS